jgi:hypothetical protein
LSVVSSKGASSEGGSFSWAVLDKALINTIDTISVTAVRSKTMRLNALPPSTPVLLGLAH